MRVAGYSWAGVRTADFDATVRFFAETLGLPLAERDDGGDVAKFRLPSGQVFEVFGPDDRRHDFLHCPAVGFEVDDLRAARRTLEAKSVEFVTDVLEWGDAASCYFRGPDCHLYEIWQPAGSRPRAC